MARLHCVCSCPSALSPPPLNGRDPANADGPRVSTGQAGRRFTPERRAARPTRAKSRPTRRPLAAVVFDLDQFKAINDTHGHAKGDETLSAVGHAQSNPARQRFRRALWRRGVRRPPARHRRNRRTNRRRKTARRPNGHDDLRTHKNITASFGLPAPPRHMTIRQSCLSRPLRAWAALTSTRSLATHGALRAGIRLPRCGRAGGRDAVRECRRRLRVRNATSGSARGSSATWSRGHRWSGPRGSSDRVSRWRGAAGGRCESDSGSHGVIGWSAPGSTSMAEVRTVRGHGLRANLARPSSRRPGAGGRVVARTSTGRTVVHPRRYRTRALSIER